MEERNYFQKALSDFAFDVAGGGAIRHLADRGFTAKQIAAELDFALPFAKIQTTIWDHLVKQKTILLEEPGSGAPAQKAVFVEERGKFGKKSFRRVAVSDEAGAKKICWIQKEAARDPMGYLCEKRRENGRETAYLSCDFGVLQQKDAKQYRMLLGLLDERQREYLEGLPWIGRRVYHRLDARMWEIAGNMVLRNAYTGCFYFGGTGEKICVAGTGNKSGFFQHMLP